MDPPAVDRHADLRERTLPGDDVCVHGVDECSVEVEDERLHCGNVMPSRWFAVPAARTPARGAARQSG
jgi:hypothetical protein